ncbi:MAG: V-type ATP synthase subunit I [Candidatus Woesearchaeota archaeon]
MIFPERMMRLTFVGPKSVLERTVKELYSLKVMHIIEHTKGEVDIGSPLQRADELSGLLVTVRALISSLGFKENENLSNGFCAGGVKNFRELAKTIKNADDGIKARASEISSISENLRELEVEAGLLRQLSGIPIPLESYNLYKSLACFVGTVADVKGMRNKISSITDRSGLYISPVPSERKVISLFIDKAYSQNALAILTQFNFSELDLSPIKGLVGLPAVQLHSVQEREASARKKLAAARLALEKEGEKWKDLLLLSKRFLEIELEKAEAPLKFASTNNIFVITGWVPEKKLGFVKQQLTRAGMDKVSIEARYPDEHDVVPSMLENPKEAKPFEFFLRLYAMPQHSEIDPTVFMAITFPLFFGFIIGDIGYGIVLLAMFLLMMKKLPALKDLIAVMAISAVSSIIFGFVFGEFFGAEQLFGHELPRLLIRTEGVVELMYIAIAVGLVQLNLGYALGFVNVFRAHGLKHALLEKGSWILFEVGIALIALPFLGIKLPAYLGYGILLISLAGIWMGEKIRGIVEIPGLFSNVLSYTRLMAVGVASASLAVVVNDFAGSFFAKGGLFIIGAILLLLIGHVINIALGILGGFLHSTRLHYVEFFGKFFKGGAIPYRPFGEK